ncbi:MAG: GtrA family protein [Candidatus Colwellbacteria bacterium]|nr:GtrA family protein [Candidatus Colwellbacteria bacterium]
MKFNKKDLHFSIITGLIAGVIAWRVFIFLDLPEVRNISWYMLILVVPILWIVGVNLGYFLGRWLKFFNQFGKFAAVGFTNAAVYFGVLNVLIYYSGFNKGLWYSVFVAVAFTLGTIHSYFWNKYWVFSADKGGVSGGELGKFFMVYIVAGIINTGIASGLVNFVTPMFGLTSDQWANIGGVAGSAAAIIISFVGVKLTVFKK